MTGPVDRRPPDLMAALKASFMSEADLQTAVIQLAQLRGWLVFHARPGQTGGRWATQLQGDAGFPDLVLCRHRELLFVELKSETGKLSPAQVKWLETLQTVEACCGIVGVVMMWRPGDWLSGMIERRLA